MLWARFYYLGTDQFGRNVDTSVVKLPFKQIENQRDLQGYSLDLNMNCRERTTA
jgi:hypothetical protein